MSLANAFPEEFRRARAEQHLVPGAVIYLEVVFPQVTKNKYLVLVGSAGADVLNFIVNSETHQYILDRPELNRCQVTMDQASHSFLDYDSNIACHDVLSISRSEIIEALVEDFDRYVGNISSDVRNNIIAAVKAAVTLSVAIQNEIISSLTE